VRQVQTQWVLTMFPSVHGPLIEGTGLCQVVDRDPWMVLLGQIGGWPDLVARLRHPQPIEAHLYRPQCWAQIVVKPRLETGPAHNQ